MNLLKFLQKLIVHHETVEVEAKDEDEAMEIFNDGDSKIISSKIKTEDIDEVKEVSK